MNWGDFHHDHESGATLLCTWTTPKENYHEGGVTFNAQGGPIPVVCASVGRRNMDGDYPIWVVLTKKPKKRELPSLGEHLAKKLGEAGLNFWNTNTPDWPPINHY